MRALAPTLGHLVGSAAVSLALSGCAGSATAGKTDAPPTATAATAEAPQRAPEPVKREGRETKAAAAKELDRAVRAAQAGELDGAITAARSAIEKDPSLEKAYLLLGSTCAMKNDVACETDAYARGTQALPTSASLANEQGMLLLRTGDEGGAIKALERAHELSGKKDAKFMADLAYAYTFVDRLAEAEQLAASATKLNPKSFDAASAYGEILLRKKDGRAALAAFRAAEALSDDPEVRRQLERRISIALAVDGRYAEALAIHEQLIEADPNDPILHVLAAESLMKLKKPKDAVKHMQAAVRLAPEDVRFLGLLLQTQEQAGDKQGAGDTKKRLESLKGKR